MRCRLRSSRYQSNIRITPLRRLHLIRLTAFATFSSRRRLFLSCDFQETWLLFTTIAVSQFCFPYPTTPPWHADRRSAQGVRSTTEGETFKGTDGACADPDTRIFPATGAYSPTPPSSFIQSAFTSTAQPSLILSWAPRKNRTPYSKYRPPPYSSSRGTDASCTCVSFSATPRNSSFTSESSSGSAIVSDGVRLPPRMRVISVSG